MVGIKMAVGFGCKCPERKKPVRERNWVVTEYKWNSGAFVTNGGEYSNYSEVRCLHCCARGRTKAKFVDSLKEMDREDAMKIAFEQLSKASNAFDMAS